MAAAAESPLEARGAEIWANMGVNEAEGDYVDDDGLVTVLLGLTGEGFPNTVTGLLSPIRTVDIKVLTVAGTAFCVTGTSGVTDARAEIANRLAAQGDPLWSSPTRPSVV
ncbi:hypothetical protein [Nocardia lijiangensis]|uniref:hypothetical protein n=1 Tax=Nocardia lijiangensis TaxID=299618 RepID=UPI003D70C062